MFTVGTLFQFENIHQSLLVYLYIRDLFCKYHVIVKQHTFQKTLYFILKSHYFGYGLLKNRLRHP